MQVCDTIADDAMLGKDVRFPVAIVGGGLAGLVVARELEIRNIDYVLFEARERLGGRILTVDLSGEMSSDGFDLGPSWFWPGEQPVVERLRKQLGLSSFAQHGAGDIMFQRMARERPQRAAAMHQSHGTMRFAGGAATLISALESQITTSRIKLGWQALSVEMGPHWIKLTGRSTAGAEEIIKASSVVFALPPRLLLSTVSFSPALNSRDKELWQNTPTWMAPHAKFFAVYDRPFWREDGLSGTAQSMVGPLTEIHDATTSGEQAALFGFVGIPAGQRQAIGREGLIEAALEQLGQLFGPAAASPMATLLKDWAADPLTAVAGDQLAGGHPSSGTKVWVSGIWQDQIVLAGSETSPADPGYLAGAIHAGEIAALEIVRRIESPAAADRAELFGSG